MTTLSHRPRSDNQHIRDSNHTVVVRHRVIPSTDAAFVAHLAARERQPPIRRRVGDVWRMWGAPVMRYVGRAVAVVGVFVVALLAVVPAGPVRADAFGVPNPIEDTLSDLGDELSAWARTMDKTMCDRKKLRVEDPSGGVDGMFGAAERIDRRGKDRPDMLWAQHGTAGSYWSTYGLHCFTGAGDKAMTSASNYVVWYMPRMLAGASIYFFQWVFSGQVLDYFLQPTDPAKGGRSSLAVLIEATHAQLYAQLLALAIVIAALVMFWRAIIVDKGAADFLSKFVVMILVAGFTAWFAANADWALRGLNNATNGMTDQVFVAFSGATCQLLPGVKPTDCHINGDNANGVMRCPSGRPAAADPSIAGPQAMVPELVDAHPLDCIGQTFYHALIFTPWANGAIGPINGEIGGENWRRAVAVLEYQSYGFDELASQTETAQQRLARHEQLRDHFLKAELGAEFDSGWDAKAWEYQRTDRSDDPTVLSQRVSRPDLWTVWSGGDPDARFTAGLLGMLGALAISAILIILATAYVVLELATIIFAVLAPLIGLIGLVPGIGTRVVLRWAELFIGAFLKRVALAVFAGLIMALYTMILSLPMPWTMQILLTVAIGLVGIAYRGKFASILDITGSGSDPALGLAAKIVGGTAVAGASGAIGAGRFAKRRKEGARARVHRMRGAWGASGHKLDKRGKQVGRLRRGAMALYAGARGPNKEGGSSARGYRGVDRPHRQYGRGAAHARSVAERRGYASDHQAMHTLRAARLERDRHVNAAHREGEPLSGRHARRLRDDARGRRSLPQTLSRAPKPSRSTAEVRQRSHDAAIDRRERQLRRAEQTAEVAYPAERIPEEWRTKDALDKRWRSAPPDRW